MMPNSKIDVVLLCGGKGTRFREVTNDKMPKSLYPVMGKELIQYSIDTLDSQLVGKLIFATDYQADVMNDWIQSHTFPFDIEVTRQIGPGIVGAVQGAARQITSKHFIVCNTDEIREQFSLERFLSSLPSTHPYDTGYMATTTAANLYRHRLIESDNQGIIVRTALKNYDYLHKPDVVGLINIGFLLLPTSYIADLDVSYGDDWSSIIDPLVTQRRLVSVPGDVGYYNIGTVHELQEALARPPTQYT